jgi:hypothetical protein
MFIKTSGEQQKVSSGQRKGFMKWTVWITYMLQEDE